MIALSLTVLVGMFGMAFDMGRLYIAKTELQTYVDSSVMASIGKLDGTQTGLVLGNTTATSALLANNWQFGTSTVSGAAATYGTSYTGTYDSFATASGPTTNNYRFLKLTATVNVPIYFMRVIPGLQ